MKKILKILINIILTLVLAFSIFSICKKLYQYKEADKIYTSIRETIKDVGKVSTDNSDNSENNDKYKELYNQNPDYRFWIKIKDTNVDYPVVQGTDNDFYLTHDFYKNLLASGCIFMDYRNNLANDKNVVLYGHHMRNKSMFADIVNYKKESFFKENNFVEIEYKGKTYTYEVFSVYIANLNNKDHVEVVFNTDEEFKNYIDYITERSIYQSSVNIDTSDKILTLFTCSYEFKEARTIVHAKLISTN